MIPTLGEASRLYLQELASRTRISTQDNVWSMLRAFGSEVGADLPMSELRREAVVDFFTWLSKRQLCDGTKAKYLTALRSFFRWAREARGWLREDPARGIGPFAVSKRSPALPQREAEIVEAINLIPKTGARDAALLALYTGLRKGSVLAILPAWYHPKEGEPSVLVIPAEVMKTRRAFTVVLRWEAKEILDRRCAGRGKDEPIFEFSRSYLNYHFSRALHRAGLSGLTVHDLRKCFLTYACQRKVPIEVAMRLTGHRTFSTVLEIYRDVQARETLEAIQWQKPS